MADRLHPESDPAGAQGRCCTTTSTAGCGPRRWSTWPPSTATSCPPPTRASWPRGSPRAPTAATSTSTSRRSSTPSASCRRREPSSGWPPSAPRTWPTTASSTPRCAWRPSCAWRQGLTLDEVVEADARRASDKAAAGRGHRRRPARHRHAPRRQLDGDRRGWRCATGTRAWSGSTSPAASPATRRPATSTRSARSPRRTSTSRSTPARRSGCRPSGRRSRSAGPSGSGHGVRIVDDVTVDDDGVARLGRLAVVRARPPGAAGDVPHVQHPHRRRRHDRGAPDRAAQAAAVPGDGQHRQPA